MIPLFKPYMPENLPEINTILHSGALSYGKWGRKFEEKLGAYIGNQFVATTNSFSSAMLVALAALGIGPGDEIIASPMSCLASNQPFITQGATVVWADIDPQTGTLDPRSVKSKISSKTKAIFHNHFCGYVGYIDEINAIGKENGIFVVDDAIEAFGSTYKGRRIGSIGTDMTIFSFQTVRLPNTIDGGAIVLNTKELYEKVKQIRDYGIDRTGFRDNLGEINAAHDVSLPGFGATMPEINSYIGCVQMERINSLLLTQKENGMAWKQWLLSEDMDVEFLEKDHAEPNYWVFGIRVKDKRKTMISFREKGFYASSVHLNNNAYSIFGEQVRLNGVNAFYSSFLAVPCGWWFEK